MKEKSTLPTCFLVCPIGKEGTKTRLRSDYIQKSIVNPALDGIFEVSTRADQMETYTRIDDHMIRSIIESELVIMDLTDENPNVFFEFGMRFALADKPYICICKKKQIDNLPFDIRQLKVIGLPDDLIDYDEDFNQLDEDLYKAKSEIRNLAKSILDNPRQFISPIGREAKTLNQLAKRGEESDILRTILDRISELGGMMRNMMAAVPHILDISSRPGSALPPSNELRDFFNAGKRMLEDLEYEKAARLFESVLEIDPGHMGALYYLGECLLGLGKLEEAKEMYEKALDIKPGFTKAKKRIEMIDQRLGNV